MPPSPPSGPPLGTNFSRRPLFAPFPPFPLFILINALSQIVNNKDFFSKEYILNTDGDYQHKEFTFSSKDYFSLTGTIDKDITS